MENLKVITSTKGDLVVVREANVPGDSHGGEARIDTTDSSGLECYAVVDEHLVGRRVPVQGTLKQWVTIVVYCRL